MTIGNQGLACTRLLMSQTSNQHANQLILTALTNFYAVVRSFRDRPRLCLQSASGSRRKLPCKPHPLPKKPTAPHDNGEGSVIQGMFHRVVWPGAVASHASVVTQACRLHTLCAHAHPPRRLRVLGARGRGCRRGIWLEHSGRAQWACRPHQPKSRSDSAGGVRLLRIRRILLCGVREDERRRR
jgi:hypothetical protein